MLKAGIQIIFELLLLILLFFSVFVFRSFNILSVFITVLAFLILMFFLIKFKKPIKKKDKALYYIIGGGCLLYHGIFYLAGLFSSFSTNYSVFYKSYLPKLNILMFIALIIMIETIRYLIISNLNHQRKDYKYVISRSIMILNYIIVDYIITGQSTNFKSNYEIFNLLILFIIPNITKHLFLDYVSREYGYKGTYLYRVIMDMYIFIVPIIPNTNIFIKTVCLSVLPYVLYIAMERTFGKTKRDNRRERSKKKRINIISVVIFAILVYLVSCQFTYGMVAVGSKSMQGTIDKGDAVIYKRYSDEKLDVGDVIVFQQNNVIIIHRIYAKVNTVGDYEAYITKGDANNTEDNWIVTQENIIGVVKARVLLIAWPSVLINEWL